MKRDKDRIRDLLFRYEADDEWIILTPGQTLSASENEKLDRYHVLLMTDEGLITEIGEGTCRLTSAGHDLLDAIRDDDIWSKTKTGASAVGGMTLGMIRELAMAYLKEEAALRLGVKL